MLESHLHQYTHPSVGLVCVHSYVPVCFSRCPLVPCLGVLAQDGGQRHLHTSREGDVLRTVKFNDILVSDCRTKVIPSCSSSDIVVNEILNSNPSTFVVARQVLDCISQYTHITWKVIVYTATVQLIHHLYR